MKTIRISAALLAAVILCTALAACGGGALKGTYKAESFGTGASYTFSGKKVTVDILVLGSVLSTLEGTYEIKDGKITLTFEKGEAEDVEKYGGTYDFSQTDNAIKIGLIEYQKVG